LIAVNPPLLGEHETFSLTLPSIINTTVLQQKAHELLHLTVIRRINDGTTLTPGRDQTGVTKLFQVK
jgi:hypothetical protein